MSPTPPRHRHDGDPRPGETFYQGLLDAETGAVPASLRATSAGHLEHRDIAPSQYFSREFHDLEMAHVWRKVWQVACRAEQLPDVGDSLVYDIGDTSLVVVRTAAGTIRAFHNSCLHRGTQLRTQAGHLDKVRCPYHGITWNIDGTLRHIPSDWDFPDLDRDAFTLPEARVDTWGGFVFVNLDPNAAPLAEYLQDLPEHFAAWPLEQRYLKAHVVRTVPCNWKVALEAFIESYHVMAVHPQLLTTAADSLTEYDVYGSHVSRMVTAVGVSSEHLADPPTEEQIATILLGKRADLAAIAQGASARRVAADGVRASLARRTGGDFSAVSDAEVLDGIEYFCFPNFMPWGGFLTSFAYTFRPAGNDPESCIIDIMVLEPLAAGSERPPAARTRVLGPDEHWNDVPELGVFGKVFNQDGATFARVQRGLRASVRSTTMLSQYQESRIRHFHATLDAYITKGTANDE